ncbi:MAG TPA: sigma factor [Candidatus Dormibacteraeota bacterium]|nr:sigma factor [Candidatus Dormibacteraeota bacterium]
MAAQFQPDELDDSHALGPLADDNAALRDLVREVRLNRPLQAGELERLLERSAPGDRPSQDRLVAVHLAMVIRLAVARRDQGLSVSDLVQEGSIGLVEAVRSFDAGAGIDFVRFAEGMVGAHLDAAIAAESAAVRDAQLLVMAATDYERTELAMRLELHREPTTAEIAEKLEWTAERTRYVAQVVADARRRHDEELLAFIDPEALDFGDDDDERAELDG